MRNKFLMLLLLSQVMVAQAAPNDVTTTPSEAATLEQADELTATVLKRSSSPKLRSSIALIYDVKGKRPLYVKNIDAVVPIASISKLMTAMVVLDAQLPLDEEISISTLDIDLLKGTHSRMRPGMSLTRGTLLKLALMASENRAAAALARTYPGGTQAAIAMMNAKARELGMTNTRFLDSTGLNSGNVSTAQDLVKMVVAAQSYSLIHEATTSSSHFVEPTGYRAMRFNNTNPLVKSAAWDIGISKTGYISEAGRCLVMEAKIRQRPVVIVLLDSWGKQTRVGDANRIKRWMESALQRVRTTRHG
ncbi:MAG: D-alanyl-D-alanine endopeptidase [Pseudomonadota bacterium]